MKSVNSKGYSQIKKFRSLKQRPKKKLPIISSAWPSNTQKPNGFKKGFKMIKIKLKLPFL